MHQYFHKYVAAEDEKNKRPAPLRDRIIAQLIDGIVLALICCPLLFMFSNGGIQSVWIAPMIPQYVLDVLPGYLPGSIDFIWGGAWFDLTLPTGRTLHLNYPAPLFLLIYMYYYSFFTRKFGQTPGKMLKHLVVLTSEGDPPGLDRAIVRWLGYFLSAGPLGLGFWYAVRDEKSRTWHDRLSGTAVLSYDAKD